VVKTVNPKNVSKLLASGYLDQSRQTIDVSESVDTENLAKLLVGLGCPKSKSSEMSQQLAKRSKQLAKERNQTQTEAMAYLINLMSQGWAAQDKTDAN